MQDAVSRCEQENTTDSDECREAMLAYYEHHVCRLLSWRNRLVAGPQDLNEDIYRHRWGPSDLTVTGTLKDFDMTARLPWVWMTFPERRENGLAACLASHWPRKVDTAHGMTIALSNLSSSVAIPEYLMIKPIASTAELGTFCRVAKNAHPMSDADAAGFLSSFDHADFTPNTRLQGYVGWVDGEPVVTSGGYFGEDGSVGIYCISTLEAHRGKGIGKAMTAFPMIEVRQRSYSIAVLRATDAGHNVYRSLGLEDYFDVELWMDLPEGETIILSAAQNGGPIADNRNNALTALRRSSSKCNLITCAPQPPPRRCEILPKHDPLWKNEVISFDVTVVLWPSWYDQNTIIFKARVTVG